MKRLSIDAFRAEVRAQGMPSNEDVAFVCPRCGCVQSGRDLIDAGAGADMDAVMRYIGFSCVGRFNGAGSPRREPDGKPCNWTLGGLFQLHTFEILDEQGKAHPHFELATPEQARAHLEARQREEVAHG